MTLMFIVKCRDVVIVVFSVIASGNNQHFTFIESQMLDQLDSTILKFIFKGKVRTITIFISG